MCGIIGVQSSKIDRPLFEQARDRLSHRGPNDAGYFCDPRYGVQLGHRRLSILDLSSGGHQPMSTPDGRYWVTFNGEIYNYIELKKELESFYSFQTQSDTEVLLAAFVQWGERCVDRFNGMFAFAIHDTHTGEIFCARDRLGEKPFYYFSQEKEFYFASEIKALLEFGINPKPNQGLIYDYLSFGAYDHTDETFFADIKKLPAGHFLRHFPNGRLEIKKYWDLEKPTFQYEGKSYEDLQEHFRNLLEDSIRLRFRSDVPVGINVSSGLDSTSLLFFAEKVTGTTPHLFSMCLPDEKYNECKFIDGVLTAEQRKYWHTSSLQPKEMFSLADQMNNIQDEPYGGIPTIAYTKLGSQATEQKVTVLLEGQGVDEILAGYSYYRVEYLQDLLAQKKWKELFHFAKYLHGTVSWPAAFYSTLAVSKIDTAHRSQDLSRQGAASTLSDEFRAQFEGKRNPLNITKFQSKLLNAQYRDIFFTKLPRVLRFNDHVTMHHGKELRLPYLDHRIVEFCFFLPSEYKIIPGRHKRLMRDAMENIIPTETNRKEKVAFGAVQTPWLRQYYKDEVTHILESSSFASLPYFNHKKIKEQADAFFQGQGDNSFFIWQWVNLEMWFRRFIA